MNISFHSKKPSACDALIIGVYEGKEGLSDLKKIDPSLSNMMDRIEKIGSFKGKYGETFLVAAQDSTCPIIMLVGIGKKLKVEEPHIVELGGKIYAALKQHQIIHSAVFMDSFKAGRDEPKIAAMLAFGIRLRSYSFDRYITVKKDKKAQKYTIYFLTSKADAAKKHDQEFNATTEGVFLTRDLVSSPPNDLNPPSYAKEIEKLKKVGLKVEVLGEKEMKALGMGSLLGVGQGSVFESKLVVIQWNGSKKKSEKPLAFVGKGVTFDTGGISLKPSSGMDEMKYDMGGSGVVVGLMKTLALRKAPVNAVGIVGLVENMPGGNAQRPGDIVTSMSGQTIEILNTDAEGRLVLADALWYCQDRFKPQFMINLATLTGAIVVTFGSIYAGLFSNNDALAKKIESCGRDIGENCWRLPIGDDYDKQIDSPVADMQNIGSEKGAGSITAAQFLQRFVNNVPWAHLDIAGVAWTKKDLNLCPKGATAWGVRLLNHLVAKHYE